MPLSFRNLLDLARLPYFEVRDGRLSLADASLGPVVDCHAHLALAYGPRSARAAARGDWRGFVDLERETPEVELYLRADEPVDLDVYMNRNFAPRDLAAIERDMTRDAFGPRGMRATHTLPNLRRTMRDVGVAASVLLPIDFPFWSRNSERWLDLTRGDGAFVCFGSVHPYRRRMREQVDALVARGARGLKFHPAVQLVAPDDRRAMKLYRACAAHAVPILYHCGPVDVETRLGRRLCQVKRYERAIAENPDVDFVLGHSGALQVEQAIAYASKYDNVYYEVASQSLTSVERLLDSVPEGRLMTGSDWPFYHPATAIAKVLLATEKHGARARRAVLYDNAARLFRLPPREERWGASPASRTS